MRKNLFFTLATALLITTSCTRTETEEKNPSGNTLLRFVPKVAQQTRAAESTIETLGNAATLEASAIPINAYKGILSPIFKEKLTYNGSNWNTMHDRFVTNEPISFFSYYATDADGKAALSSINYVDASDNTSPLIKDFTIGTTAATQVDLIAAKVQNTVDANINLSFKHLLSQVNFGVCVASGQKVVIKNIKLSNISHIADFDFGTWSWKSNTSKTNYDYTFPDGNDGEGYIADNQNGTINGFIFGDGGGFGAEETNITPKPNFVYAQADKTWKAAEESSKLKNSFMLLPQAFNEVSDAKISFNYTVKNSANDAIIKNGTANIYLKTLTTEFKANYRYIFMFNILNEIVTQAYAIKR